MRPIVTDRVAWSVGRFVTLVSPAKTAEVIEMPFGLRTRVGQRNHVLDGGMRRSILRTKREPLWTIGTLCRELWVNGWTDQCHLRRGLSIRWNGHWRHLPNTTEPFVCGDDAALCRITLTTCYHSWSRRPVSDPEARFQHRTACVDDRLKLFRQRAVVISSVLSPRR